jgi:hypothetical protein
VTLRHFEQMQIPKACLPEQAGGTAPDEAFPLMDLKTSLPEHARGWIPEVALLLFNRHMKPILVYF